MLSGCAWRSRWGAAFAGSPLFPGTVLENVTVYEPEPDPERLARAAEASGLEEELEQLGCGPDTVVGVEGRGAADSRLAQRLLVVRALYQSQNYLILGEVTETWEPEQERSLARSIRRNHPRHTVVWGTCGSRLRDLGDRSLQLDSSG